MNRRSSIVVAFVAAGSLGLSLTACNAPTCGQGTKQVQQTDGTVRCVPADAPAQLTECDVDAGSVMIVGGKCVSAVVCDPDTTMNENGVCVGTGGTSVASCHSPTTGHACVSGSILNFTDNVQFMGAVHVELYDPITFLSSGNPIDSTDVSNGSYVFQDFVAPTLGLIVIVTGHGSATFTTAASPDQGIGNGNKYKVDAYVVKKADSDAWGFDLSQGGGYIARFFNDPKPMNTDLTANEKNPVSGVTLLENGATPTGIKYFNATLTAIGPALTATSASGAAIVAAPVVGSFPNFTGMGGGITWETEPGGSANNAVLVGRFHPN